MDPTDKKPVRDERKEKILEANIEKEKSLNLVLKIISWKTGSRDSRSIQNNDKISPTEWATYKKYLLQISKTETPEKIKEKLKIIYGAIKNNDGFK